MLCGATMSRRELKALGADVVLADGPDLAARARQAAGGAPIRLGIDAVSGEACKRIADSVADGGVVVTYGSMSGADPVISRAALGRGISLKGFMLGDGLAKRTRRAGPGDLCRSRRQAARRCAEGADRGLLPDRRDQAGARPRSARRPQRQGAGTAQRPAVTRPDFERRNCGCRTRDVPPRPGADRAGDRRAGVSLHRRSASHPLFGADSAGRRPLALHGYRCMMPAAPLGS